MASRFVAACSLAFLLLAAAPAAHAATETVATPAGTFHLVYDADPGLRDRVVCARVCVTIPLPEGPAVPQVWQESNDCPGLQRTPTTCQSTGLPAAADTRVLPP